MGKRNTLIGNILHIMNDGFRYTCILLLPFIARDLRINLTSVGILGTAISIVEVFLSLFVGIIAFRIGSMRTLVLSLCMYTMGYILISSSRYFPVYIIAYVVAGMGFALYHPVANAIISRGAAHKKQGSAIGNFGAIGDIGRVAIPVVLTISISLFGWRMSSVIISIVLIFCSMLLTYIFVLKKENNNLNKPIRSLTRYRHIIKNHKYILASLCGVFDTFANVGIVIYLPFLILQRYDNPIFLGVVTTAFFIGGIVGKKSLDQMVDTHGNAKTFIYSEILMALLIVVLAWIPNLIVTFITSVMLGVVTKGTTPIVSAMVADIHSEKESLEKVFGLTQFITAFALASSPFIVGYFSDHWGINYAFMICAIVALIATIPAVFFKANTNQLKS